MTNIYIVVEGGCVRYVASDTEAEINVEVVDLDDLREDPKPDRSRLEVAETLPRIW